ncbi:MAG: hypothetical protein A2Z14_11130 [Chloroflexi bacterium RBG_16_48_8]|nr:MAG: hypothetical protein A2Z14_11130 [Chloroflexi bacterium RBG_16_48_8]
MSTISSQAYPSRPSGFENRYKLYMDESGDHVYRKTSETAHRFFGLLGCWFRNTDYVHFHQALEELKARHLPHHPDEPVVLHREDVLNARKAFKVLRDEQKRRQFDDELLRVIEEADFRMVMVVIDKQALYVAYGNVAAHPYHLGMGFLLQRYASYLNHIHRIGDVMAEARGGKEDRLLAESYTRVYDHGVWRTREKAFQTALSSCQLKLKQKSVNIAGLQLADLLSHPTKQCVLRHYDLIDQKPSTFAQRLMDIVESKFNHHLYDARVEVYGFVVYPRK